MAADKKGKKGKKSGSHLRVVDGIVPHDGKEEYADLRAQVLELRESIDKSRWDLAERLYQVHDESIFHHWGYSSWEQYVEVEVGMKVRTAQYLTAIYNWFVNDVASKLPDDEAKKVIDGVRKLGWTKARSLVGVATEKNVHRWLAKAEKMSSTELEGEAKKALAKSQGFDPETVPKMKNMSFRVAEEQQAIIEQALSIAGSQAESDKKGHLLSLICTDFVATSMAQKEGGQANRGRYFDKIAAQFGVQLIAVDKETSKVVHGQDVLKKIKA